ncbi:hypothetical protein XENORESO_000906 [Xenotaenia resolanae]|uniref:Uncharacterized protein n=2 Tax=Goodeidae TaxID=28758 RepID=A0ABV0WE24_9TELE
MSGITRTSTRLPNIPHLELMSRAALGTLAFRELAECIRKNKTFQKPLFSGKSDGPVGEQTEVRKFKELLLAAAHPSTHRLSAVRLGAIHRAAAAAGGGERPRANLDESRSGGGQQEQHQYQTPRQQRDASYGRNHCPSPGSHLSCTPASSHPISPP